MYFDVWMFRRDYVYPGALAFSDYGLFLSFFIFLLLEVGKCSVYRTADVYRLGRVFVTYVY